MKVKVKVPATTANLGVGFDSFGLALQLYNTVTVEPADNGVQITGCDSQYAGCDNLVYLAYKAAMDRMCIETKGVKIDIQADVPIARGLGSSAALLAAGAAAANALNGSPLSKEQLLEVTNPIEGHPDNLAPALFGGLTASITADGRPLTVSCPLHCDWHFVALIPDFPLSTSAARSVLPQSYSRSDAVHNIGRGVLVVKSLENGDENLLYGAMDDKIHQPYRRKLIEDYDVIEQLVKQNGGVFCLSGAGPTLLCISKDEKLTQVLCEKLPCVTEANWTVTPLAVDHNGVTIETE